MATEGLGPFCYLAGQVVSEGDVRQALPWGSKRPLEEALTALRKGALLLKHGRHGKPKVHFFRVGGCDTLLRWRSASGSVKQVRLRNVAEVVAGQATEVFRRYPLREGACSFSLRYRDEDGSTRTLDLTAADQQQFELWFMGLRVVAARLAALGNPVFPAAAGGSGLLAWAPGSSGMSPADLMRCVSSRMQHTAGPLCLPAADRVPCDLLAWGSAQRAPPVAHSLRSVMGVMEDCWQHRNAPGLTSGGMQLDAYRAAVGRKHVALITATGAVYAWGEGRGGKLGLGHDQDQAQPQRVRHALEGQCVVAVACGDDCTAALTDGGELFMWGRPHVDTRPQLVPLQVRGDLRGRKVVQVSCGPFHCAAVSSDGQLFTWGEGFGGKLGHGDQSNRTHPSLVAALDGWQVLEVSCGVWHTAAIVAEPEGGSSFYAPSLPTLQQHGPLKAEGSAVMADVVSEALGLPPSSPAHMPTMPHHHRNNSTSSAFSEASVFHDGVGGVLFTWGGVNESVAFGASEKWDSNKGCLGHGEADLYRGQLLPVRVCGALEGKQVRHVAAGSHLTVAVTTGGRVFQMGATGASGPAKHCPWEGATLPELVRGQLAGLFIDEVSCGMHHVVVIGRPLDRKLGRPADIALRTAFAWGRGSEGQLGVRSFDDSSAPLLVEGLKGRHVLQVACGGSNTMVVCEHDVRRWEPDSKEEAEAASRALNTLASEPKQLRIQAPGDAEPQASGRLESSRHTSEKGSMGIVRRSFSMIAARSNSISGGGGGGTGSGATAGPPNLARLSSSSTHSVRSMGGGSTGGSTRGGGTSASHVAFTQTYSFMAAPPPQHRSSMPHQLPPKQQRMRSDRTTGSILSEGELNGGAGYQQVVSIGSPIKSVAHSHSGGSHARRSTYAGGGGGGPGIGMVSARSFTMGMGGGLGGGGVPSDLSSISSWQHRPPSDDGGGVAEHEADSVGAGGTLAASNRRASSTDLATALDDMRSGNSCVAIAEELAEKNRIIEHLQRKLDKMQRQQQQQQAQQAQRDREARPSMAGMAPVPARSGSTIADAEERLRAAVRASAGAFRAAQMGGLLPPPPQQSDSGNGQARPATSSPPGTSRRHSLLRSSLLRSSGGGAASDKEKQAELAAMEAMLAKKEAHLEGQQEQLAEWAAELQRREAALAWQQAALVAAGGRPAGVTWAVAPVSPASSGSAIPEPIPSESPVLVRGRASPVAAPLAVAVATAAAPAPVPLPTVSPAVQQRVLAQEAQASPATFPIAPSSTGRDGVLPDSPAAELATDEWSEEFEEGVFLTFTSEGGAKKLRRIRFNRSLFSATSAKQWYETNKHHLAQPTGTPRVAASAATPTATAAASLGSTGGSHPGTPSALATSEQEAQRRQQLVLQAGQAAAAKAAASDAEAQAVAGLLHYRQTSRNLSFDARELATFNERLQQVLAQQQGHQAGQSLSAAAGLPPSHRPPSRLSKPSTMAAVHVGSVAGSGATGSMPGMPFAAVDVTPSRQAVEEEANGTAAASGFAGAGAVTPLMASPSLAVAGDASREWKSARSSPLTTDSPWPTSREASAAATPGDLSAIQRGSYTASGGSSPIHAAVGSRTSSPVSKTRSAASGSLSKQMSVKSDLAKYTPRAASAEQQQQLATDAAQLQQQHQGGAGSETGRSVSGSSQATLSPEVGSEGKRTSGFSAKMGRIRRSLTGGGSGSTGKQQ